MKFDRLRAIQRQEARAVPCLDASVRSIQEALTPNEVQAHALHVEVSYVVRAPREKVYAAYTDFEAMPRWSRQVTAV
ncbi:MAG: hypothetical protein LYZ66_06495, partial [Nitrososphaerales archaeon]|nr:hypothetical protein [Nitrososphaerales archaeon]